MTIRNWKELPDETTERHVATWARARVSVDAVSGMVEGLATRQPMAAPADDLLEAARSALKLAQVIARAIGAPELLPLHAPITHAGLAARLALADGALKVFSAAYSYYADDIGEYVWRYYDDLPPPIGKARRAKTPAPAAT